MRVIKVRPAGFASNSFILTADGKTAVVIDCAQPRVYDACVREGLKPEAVLLTHSHFDHVGGCGVFYEKGARIYCGEREKPLVFSEENRGLFGGVYIPDFEISGTFSDGQEVEFCGIKFKVIFTPGHTCGSVCYVAENCLFSGDTLFRCSVGRSDLPTGSAAELVRSVKKLYSLGGDYTVYCGHEGETTLAYERMYNPYVRGGNA